ncbi:DUF6887 family protein [Phormidesmis priestleyi]
MKPDFKAMTVSELRAYVLEHRENESAFHALIDQLTADEAGETHPYPNTPETIEALRKAIQKKLGQ